MNNNKLGKLISASCLALLISTVSCGGAPVASAAAVNLVPVYSAGHLFSSGTSKVTATYSLVNGRATATTTRYLPLKVTVLPKGNPVVVRPNPSPAPAPTTPSAGTTVEEQQAVNLLNADRAASGLPALRVNSQLTGLAEDYAQEMINRNFFSHTNPEGQSPFDRMRQRGISFGYAGENLAINSSVADAETAFMNSSGHRANILNPNYTQVGIGVKHGSNGSVYVVQEFTDG